MTEIGAERTYLTPFEHSIKTDVANRLSALDEQFKIAMTDYFNHSYVPDLVLTWLSSRHEQSERHIYIRSSVATPDLPEQVERIHEGRPIFMGVNPSPSWPDAVDQALASSDTALVTEDSAIEQYRPSGGEAFNIGLGASIARGGKGSLSTGRASDMVARFAEVDRGAEARADELTAALLDLNEILDERYAEAFFRYLNFIWELIGLDPDQFPISIRSGDLPEADLVRLLERLFQSDPIEEADFWHRLGKHVNLGLLEKLGRQSPHPNLDRLINFNQRSFGGRYAAVMRWMDALEGARLAWCIEDGFLELVGGGNMRLRFAIDGSRLARREPVPGPRAGDFLDRLAGRNLVSAQTESGTYRLSIESLREGNLDETIRQIKQALGATARLTSAEVEVHGTRCRIDFTLRRLRAEETLTVGALAAATAELLLGAASEELEEIETFVGSPGGEGPEPYPSLPGEMSLFDVE